MGYKNALQWLSKWGWNLAIAPRDIAVVRSVSGNHLWAKAAGTSDMKGEPIAARRVPAKRKK